MSNPYAKVIDVLNSGSVDYRRIAIELAKTSPSLFLKLHNGESLKRNVKKTKAKLLSAVSVRNICAYIFDNRTIDAIKELRYATITEAQPYGLSLKDARDIIMVAAEKEQRTLREELEAFVNEIKCGQLMYLTSNASY